MPHQEQRPPRSDNPHGNDDLLTEHFYRVVRNGPGAHQAIRESADLDELRNAVRSLLEGLEPGAFRLRSNAVTITGTHEGEEMTVTVQYFVAQPTDVWAPASGGPTTDWSAWSDTVAQEAHTGSAGTYQASTRRPTTPSRRPPQPSRAPSTARR